MPTSIELMPKPFEWITIPDGKVKIKKGYYLQKTTTFDVATFQIAKYPTTNAQFDVFINHPDGYKNPVWWDFSEDAKNWRAGRPEMDKSYFDSEDCPRDTVSWYDSVAFCLWLSAVTGEKIMLPTEQQWQRAAQGDTNCKYPWGDTIDKTYANYDMNIGRITPVTQYPKGVSPYGVMDMGGNVWEWCSTDWYKGGDKLIGTMHRVVRGGFWGFTDHSMRSVHRSRGIPTYGGYDLGFRCLRS